MSEETIYPGGIAEVLVPSAQSIAVSNYGGGIAEIYYLIISANFPPAYQLQRTLENTGIKLGPFTTATTVKIVANTSKVAYEIGASPGAGVGDAATLNGYVQDATDTASTIALRDASGDIQANAFESTVATGTAPLTVASTTKVTNLNADLLDGLHSATASTVSTIAARDASGNLTAKVLISDVATGTAPLTVASTTVVTNLNADTVDGEHASAFVHLGGSEIISGVKSFSASPILYNNKPLQIKDFTVGIARNVLNIDGSDNIKIGHVLFPSDILSSSTTNLTHNGYTIWDSNNDGALAHLAGPETLTGAKSLAESYFAQGAATAKTTSTTLTAAEIATKIITVNNGAAGTTALTLPLASAMDSQFTNVANGYSFDFSVINISIVAAEDASIATNTGWTLVGNMDIEADDDPRARSSAKFKARKTGTAAWSLYRIA